MSKPGKPLDWTPQSEMDHFMKCPVCGEIFDVRKLEQAIMHIHDGPENKKPRPSRRKDAAKSGGRL